MYAAAGGASLASRQARQKQRQNKNKEQRLQQVKSQKASDYQKTPQAKQFHNYTDSPVPPVPKLSRVERGTLKPPSQHERRHSASNYHLKEPHSRARIRESPSISIPVVPNHQPPQPLTPCTLVQQNHLLSTTSLQNQLPQIFIPEEGKLERRCSFVRQVEELEKCPEGGTGVLDRCNHICNFEIKDRVWEHNSYFTDLDKDLYGSLDYPFSECSQGRAAWQERERGRRCSLSEEARQHRIKQTEAHHRWMKRNRIHDSTYGTGSDEDDFFNVYHQSAAANALLYVGLGTTAIGSVIFFVGTGEKGFKTLELRLIGPTLIACGLLCCLIRVLLCACPSTCLRRRKKTRLKDSNCPHTSSRYPLAPKIRDTHENREFIPVDNATLLGKQKKKVSIVPPNYSLPSTSTSEFKEPPQLTYVTDEINNKPVIPQINLPEFADFNPTNMARDDSIIELQNLELSYDLESISSNESEGTTVIESDKKATKLSRTREPVNTCSGNNDTVTTTTVEDVETCLSIVIERSDNSESSDGPSFSKSKDSKDSNNGSDNKQQTHSGVVLSPLQLGQ